MTVLGLSLIAAPTAGATVVKDMPYASGSSQQVLDIWPASQAGAPIAVLVHGGEWKAGDKTDVESEARQLQANGITVFNIDYRLDSSSTTAFPMEIQDVETATEWAKAHAKQYSGNPNDITLIGGSAGGHLVGMATADLNAAQPNTVSGTVSLSGPMDFSLLAQEAEQGRFSASDGVSQALGCSFPTSCPGATEMQWSPANQMNASNCPAGGFLLYNSQNEIIPAPQADSMANTLRQAGCPETETIISGNQHAFVYWPQIMSTVFSFVHNHSTSGSGSGTGGGGSGGGGASTTGRGGSTGGSATRSGTTAVVKLSGHRITLVVTVGRQFGRLRSITLRLPSGLQLKARLSKLRLDGHRTAFTVAYAHGRVRIVFKKPGRKARISLSVLRPTNPHVLIVILRDRIGKRRTLRVTLEGVRPVALV
jgi:acetyl esterase/lipase